jgi:hypothetical protein
VNAIVKDSPSVGDVHVDGPLGGSKKRPAAPDLGDLGLGRTIKDIETEAEANRRYDGEVATSLAKGEDDMADEDQKSFESFFKVSGVDEGLGLVFGWGIVCKVDGNDYYDVQKNNIPEDAMVEATTDFMKGQRMAGEQHVRMDAGSIVHSFPLTTEIAKAMGIGTTKTGWMVACAPDKAMLAKFKANELTGFSIGGAHIEIDGKAVQ